MANVIELLSKLANEEPNHPLLDDGVNHLSNLEVYQSCLEIAGSLIEKGIENQPIVVSVSRTIDSILYFFGIAASGNCYIPVLSDMPYEKLKKIKEASLANHLIEADPLVEKGDLFETISKETLFSGKPLNNPVILDNKPLYVVFTSGSTGVPKGVIKTHENILAFVSNFLLTFPFLNEERIANQTPFSFDASAKDIYLALGMNGTLFIPDKSVFALPGETIKYLNTNHISYICWVPSALTMIAKVKALNFSKLNDLRYVYFVGEVFPPKYLNYWIEKAPDIRYFNIFGSSEVAGVSLYHEMKGIQSLDKEIPTGKPIKNNEVALLDGEILIKSKQVALGYINDPEKDKIAFDRSTNPTTLHTGDYAKIDENGDIVFQTRKDFQIKHLGYRIELQEIEVAVMALPYIDNCCCLYEKEKDKIVLFFTLNKTLDDYKKTIINDLGKKLAFYMMPNRFEKLDKMPLNQNGKIDRAGLMSLL